MSAPRGRDPLWVRCGRRVLVELRVALRLTGLAAWHGGVRFVRGDDLTFASSIAYYALLSLFPFLLLCFSLLGQVTAGEEERAATLALVFHYFPGRLEFVTQQLDAMSDTRLQLGVAGSVLLIWASLGVFGAVTNAVNVAWGVERRRSYWRHQLVSFLMLAAAGVLLLLALLLAGALSVARASWFAEVLAAVPWLAVLESLVLDYAATLLLILVVGLIFYFVPNTRVRFRDVWVGAVITGVLWRLAFEGFSWYLRDLSRLTMLHGSIVGIVVFLMWVFVSSVIFLFGVELTATYARLRHERSAARLAMEDGR